MRVRDRMPGIFNTSDPETEDAAQANGIDEDKWIEISWEEDSTSLAAQIKTQTLLIQAQTQSNLTAATAQTPSNVIPVPAQPRASLIPSAISVSSRAKTTAIANTSPPDASLGKNTSNSPVNARRITRSMTHQTPAERMRSQSRTRHQNYYIEVDHFVHDVTLVSDPNEPKTIQQALRSSEQKEWR